MSILKLEIDYSVLLREIMCASLDLLSLYHMSNLIIDHPSTKTSMHHFWLSYLCEPQMNIQKIIKLKFIQIHQNVFFEITQKMSR